MKKIISIHIYIGVLFLPLFAHLWAVDEGLPWANFYPLPYSLLLLVTLLRRGWTDFIRARFKLLSLYAIRGVMALLMLAGFLIPFDTVYGLDTQSPLGIALVVFIMGLVSVPFLGTYIEVFIEESQKGKNKSGEG